MSSNLCSLVYIRQMTLDEYLLTVFFDAQVEIVFFVSLLLRAV